MLPAVVTETIVTALDLVTGRVIVCVCYEKYFTLLFFLLRLVTFSNLPTSKCQKDSMFGRRQCVYMYVCAGGNLKVTYENKVHCSL